MLAVVAGSLSLALTAFGCGSPATPLPGVDLTSDAATRSPGIIYQAGDAGTVGFSIVDDTLRLDSVSGDEGWSWQPDADDTDDDVAIDFHHEGEGLAVDFEADIHDGVVLVEVETALPAHDRTLSWAADSAAEVIIVIRDQRVSLERIIATTGWTWTQRGDDQVTVVFADGDGSIVEFAADTDDGRLEVEVGTRWRPATIVTTR